MSETVVVVAHIFPKPECRADVIEVLNKTQAAVHENEAGCQLYALHANDDQLIMIEKWDDLASLRAHFDAEPFKALPEQLEGKLAKDIDIQQLSPVPAGTSKQGVL
ncbi:putative quinol monooxygenase [Mycolicibacterium palauense]|uniref:putative quinol monooxygenase n=1 Tax=Mycolicibacterium palauense TaxID=2034511 RepID=UPI000BFF02F9|nr:antibiotic biosynthesis monooxygenase [Mycolicibacterium palauense]